MDARTNGCEFAEKQDITRILRLLITNKTLTNFTEKAGRNHLHQVVQVNSTIPGTRVPWATPVRMH